MIDDIIRSFCRWLRLKVTGNPARTARDGRQNGTSFCFELSVMGCEPCFATEITEEETESVNERGWTQIASVGAICVNLRSSAVRFLGDSNLSCFCEDDKLRRQNPSCFCEGDRFPPKATSCLRPLKGQFRTGSLVDGVARRFNGFAQIGKGVGGVSDADVAPHRDRLSCRFRNRGQRPLPQSVCAKPRFY